jgi:hypothetical protein
MFGAFEADPASQTVHIPLTALIDSAEIPAQFRISNLDDPRLDNTQWIQEFSDWVYTKTGVQKKNSLFNETTLKSNLLFHQNGPNAKEGVKFTLMHELGHIHHKDNAGLLFEIMFYGKEILAFLIPVGIAGALLFFFTPSLPLILVSVPVTLLSWVVIRRLFIALADEFDSKPKEKRADAFAAQHAPDSIDGAIHFFKTLQEERKIEEQAIDKSLDLFEQMAARFSSNIVSSTLWNCLIKVGKLFKQFAFVPNGDNLFDFSHPLLSQRIAYFESINRQRGTNSSLSLARA